MNDTTTAPPTETFAGKEVSRGAQEANALFADFQARWTKLGAALLMVARAQRKVAETEKAAKDAEYAEKVALDTYRVEQAELIDLARSVADVYTF